MVVGKKYKSKEHGYIVTLTGIYNGDVYYTLNGDQIDMSQKIFNKMFTKV